MTDTITDKMKLEYKILQIPVASILVDNDFNCRGRDLIPGDCVDLAENIQQNGLIQPVSVAPLSEADKNKYPGKSYKLIAGFRRMMAHRILKADTIRATIREDMTDEADQIAFNLSENIERKDLNMLQEAKALIKLRTLGLSRTDYEKKLGRSWGWIQIRFFLMDLPAEVQVEVVNNNIAQGQIRQLYTVYTHQGEKALFETVRQIKDRKAKGLSGILKPKKEGDIHKKRVRKPTEMFDMQEIVRENMGNNIITSTLAWCSGAISTYDYYSRLQDYAEENGLPFDPPKEANTLFRSNGELRDLG